MKRKWSDPTYAHKQMARTQSFTSRGEREVREFFRKQFPNDGWTFGGCIKHDGYQMSRDLYSPKLQVCIEYDGIWHFEEIKDNLEYKQVRDIALERWCLVNSWRLVRIDEDVYNADKEAAMKLLVDSVYKSNDQIIKLGTRYL